MIPVLFVVAFVLIPSVKLNVCPDGSICPGADPCCSSASGYRCCPNPGGNCCSDGMHCCAYGYVCVFGNRCMPSRSSHQWNIAEAISTVDNAEQLQLSQCPSGTTDCGSSPQGEECCPLPNAVCCSDGEHCCPSGYTCDLTYGLCVKNSASDQFLQAIVKTVKNEEKKRLQVSQCPSGYTDCGSSPQGEECCPLPNAVCCSDGIHCCPNGYTCDLSSGLCIKNSASDKFLQAIVKKSQNTVCPDGNQCPDEMTCCMMTTGQYGCCAYSQAVCCPDKIHCCRNGTTCGQGGCYSATGSIPWVKKRPAL